jgi:threonine/homoserine/homoserine lactone efflux protein
MTNDLWFFLQGAMVGAFIAVPVGPVALLCIRYALAYGWRVGIVAGLGTAIADGFYGGVAALGAGFVSMMLPKHGKWFYFITASFLIYMGIKIFNSVITKDPKKLQEKKPYSRAFTSTLFLTFASPITTIVLASFFSRSDFLEKFQDASAIALAFGVMTGAFCWWVLITGIVGHLRKKLNFKFFTILNKVSGIAIFSYGIGALIKFLMEIELLPTITWG